MSINDLLKNQKCEMVRLFELLNFDKRFNGVDKEKQEKVLKFKHCSAEMLKNMPQDENGDIKLLSTGNFAGWTNDELVEDKTLINQGEVITFPSGGTASIKYHNGKFIDSGNILASSKDRTKINLKYVYYSLLNINQDIQALYRGSSIQHPSMCDIIELSIPLPPLPTQLKVVEILDKFTELQTELQTELKLRKKQYEYYRDKLLTFSEEEREKWEVRVVRLGDVCEFESIGVDKKIIEGEKMITLLNYMDVYKNHYLDKDTATMRVSASDAKIKQCDCKQFDIFITPTSETREDIAHSAVALEDLPNTCYSYHLMRCRLKQPNKITASYLRYYFDSPRARQDFWKIAKGQTRYVISKYDVGKIVVPFPPISRQKEIVEILDKFDTLVNDISKGLPREIELRRKQYEYYREKLVRFGEG